MSRADRAGDAWPSSCSPGRLCFRAQTDAATSSRPVMPPRRRPCTTPAAPRARERVRFQSVGWAIGAPPFGACLPVEGLDRPLIGRTAARRRKFGTASPERFRWTSRARPLQCPPSYRSQPTRTKQGHIMNALLICSGGFDSVTLAYRLAAEQSLGALLTFDYGQRHRKEIDAARLTAERLTVPHLVMDIGQIGRQLSGSALTDDIAVPHGHYSEENMKVTVVPNRNAIMLTIAFGVAASR